VRPDLHGSASKRRSRADDAESQEGRSDELSGTRRVSLGSSLVGLAKGLSCGDRCRQCAPQQFDRLGLESEEGPAATLFSFEKSCLGEDFQVVADRRLRKAERFRQVADAHLPCRTDQAEETETRRIGNDPQGGGQSLRRRFIERSVSDGCCPEDCCPAGCC
jgi:hypothetical protein